MYQEHLVSCCIDLSRSSIAFGYIFVIRRTRIEFFFCRTRRGKNKQARGILMPLPPTNERLSVT